jgi:hypothetical protein
MNQQIITLIAIILAFALGLYVGLTFERNNKK